jgi:prepilin-type N-terminal cleavage/methylation domain-containing protein
MRNKRRGFTLIELMMVVAIIAVLVGIALPRYHSMVFKSKEGQTRGNAATIRSALSIYYTDNEQAYPTDNLASLTIATRYLPVINPAKAPPMHADSLGVLTETTPTDTGSWSYNNDPNNISWGRLTVGCTHTDSKGTVWTTF